MKVTPKAPVSRSENPKTQVVQPTPQNPESEDTIKNDLAAFDKMRRTKCPKCDIWDPEVAYCTAGITIGDAPMGKCSEFKKIQPTLPKQAPKQESPSPKTEISGLLKMARSRVSHHVPKCPVCGDNKCFSMGWDGRRISLTCDVCGNVQVWDPSPSWAQIMIVEKWLSGL